MHTRTRHGKQHILEVAEKLFTEHGYQSVSIRDIAQASGVTNAALYYHFPSKQALFDEVIEFHTDKLAHLMERARISSIDTQEKLRAIIIEYATQVSDRRSLLFSLRRNNVLNQSDQWVKKQSDIIQRMLAPIEDTLESAIERGELRKLPGGYSPASLLLGLFHGMLQHRKYCTNDQVSLQDIDIVIDLFWHGLKF